MTHSTLPDSGAVVDDSVLELRQYTLRGGQRDTLITLFENEFIEPQDAVGAHVRGTFRDLDDPDRFVWLRSFADMAARQRALQAFYGGSVWQAHRNAANATIVDSDNVLLLRPVATGMALPAHSSNGPEPAGSYALAIHYLANVDPVAFRNYFLSQLIPALTRLDAPPLALFETESAPNNFPRLPVRARDAVFAWLGRWPDAASQATFLGRWRALSGWRDSTPEPLLPTFMRKPEVLRLSPTDRSALR